MKFVVADVVQTVVGVGTVVTVHELDGEDCAVVMFGNWPDTVRMPFFNTRELILLERPKEIEEI